MSSVAIGRPRVNNETGRADRRGGGHRPPIPTPLHCRCGDRLILAPADPRPLACPSCTRYAPAGPNPFFTPAGDLTRDATGLLRYYAARLARHWPFGITPEEVFQEAVVSLLRKAGRYDPARGNVPAFLYVIARDGRNRLLGRNRRAAGRERPADPAGRLMSARAVSREPDPRAAAEHAEELAGLRLALAALPDCQRRLVVRRFGLDGGEPAKLHELPGGVSRQCQHELLKGALWRMRYTPLDRSGRVVTPAAPRPRKKLMRLPVADRRRRVAELRGQGVDNRTIAARLDVSLATVVNDFGAVRASVGAA
jgi:RNA polymerase sigma factor (sigma-70 family)